MTLRRNYPIWACALVLALAWGGTGCAGAPAGENAASEQTPADEPAPDAVLAAAAIAAELEAAPERAAEILESHGMTPEQWQALMYEIASDPERAAAYAAAKQQAKP